MGNAYMCTTCKVNKGNTHMSKSLHACVRAFACVCVGVRSYIYIICLAQIRLRNVPFKLNTQHMDSYAFKLTLIVISNTASPKRKTNAVLYYYVYLLEYLICIFFSYIIRLSTAFFSCMDFINV